MCDSHKMECNLAIKGNEDLYIYSVDEHSEHMLSEEARLFQRPHDK